MTDLISRPAVIEKLKKAYWDKNIQSAKNDPCVIDAMTDWAIRQVKEAPSSNPWHTGNPTEEGDYLVKLDVEHHVYPYYVLKWNKGGWYSRYNMDYPACPQHRVLKWQKIEED